VHGRTNLDVPLEEQFKGELLNESLSSLYIFFREMRGIMRKFPVGKIECKDCVTTMAQYVYDQFGRCPGTASSMFMMMFLQAHHLDLEFYDKHFKPGSCLRTHAQHMKQWHSNK
jgi:hypothetical protein